MYVVNPDSLAIITVWMEAQGEPYEGKVGVSEVIRNRMLQNYSSDGTVAGTVAKRYQFSGWNDDAQDNALLIRALKCDETNDPIVRECIRAWNQSRITNYVKGALLYCNRKISNPDWAKDDKFLVKIGNHSFYAP